MQRVCLQINNWDDLRIAFCIVTENIFQLAADHLSIDGAGDREPGAISFAICSEDPHRSLACNESQQNECVGINISDIDHRSHLNLYKQRSVCLTTECACPILPTASSHVAAGLLRYQSSSCNSEANITPCVLMYRKNEGLGCKFCKDAWHAPPVNLSVRCHLRGHWAKLCPNGEVSRTTFDGTCLHWHPLLWLKRSVHMARWWCCSAAQSMSGLEPETVGLRLLTWSGAAQRCSQP